MIQDHITAKLSRSGNSFHIIIPKKLIDVGILDEGKRYKWIWQEESETLNNTMAGSEQDNASVAQPRYSVSTENYSEFLCEVIA